MFHSFTGVTQYFPCNEWLDPKDPMSLNKTLLPRDADGNIGQLLQYEVRQECVSLLGFLSSVCVCVIACLTQAWVAAFDLRDRSRPHFIVLIV